MKPTDTGAEVRTHSGRVAVVLKMTLFRTRQWWRLTSSVGLRILLSAFRVVRVLMARAAVNFVHQSRVPTPSCRAASPSEPWG